MLPRIPPPAPDERAERATELPAQVGAPVRSASNLFATLARHPGLLCRRLPVRGELLAGRLPDRDHEPLILRTAHRCGSDQIFAQMSTSSSTVVSMASRRSVLSITASA